MIPVILGLTGLGLIGYHLNNKGIFGACFGYEDKSVLNPTDRALYEHILEKEKNPEKIKAIGVAFIAKGHTKEGNILLKRAQIGALPKEAKKARRMVMKQALSSFDAPAIEKVASVFENEGCVGVARTLNEYAGAIRNLPNVR